MKNIIAVLLFSIFILSCKKDKETRSLEKDMEGKWEMVSSADFAGYRTYTRGNGDFIEFASKNTFKRRVNHALTFQGKFSLEHKQNCLQRTTDMLLTTTEPGSTPYYVEFKSDTLFFSTSNCSSEIIRGYKKL